VKTGDEANVLLWLALAGAALLALIAALYYRKKKSVD